MSYAVRPCHRARDGPGSRNADTWRGPRHRGSGAVAESWGLQRNDEIDRTLVMIAPLGGGSRYEVFYAWDRTLFAPVAAKVLRPHRIEETRARDGLSREADVLGRLAHPNLVRLLRWSDAPPRPYLVLELVTASTLDDHLEAVGPLGMPEACLLGIRLLSALGYLHERGLLHLDVKPANVTLGDPPKLLDLSLARSATEVAARIGTRGYMAPEICTGSTVGPSADLFGVGATLYEALTAMQPFSEGDDSARDPEARYPQLIEEPPPLRQLLPGIPPRLEEVIHACMAREPARRPSSATDAALALYDVLVSLDLGDLLPWPRDVDIARPT